MVLNWVGMGSVWWVVMVVVAEEVQDAVVVVSMLFSLMVF